MRASRLVFSLAWTAVATTVALGAPKSVPAPGEPAALSVYPFTGRRGATFTATVRGNGLREAISVFVEQAPFTLALEGIESEPPQEAGAKGKAAADLVHLRVAVAPDARPGRYSFRIVTRRGVSNALAFHIVDYPVFAEPEGSHETPETAVPAGGVPAVFTGRILRRGESDFYAFQVKAGDTLTFEAISGLPSPGGPGNPAAGFDPSISLYKPSPSWFDPKRINRIAFNDEPLWEMGRPTDAYLVHRFAEGGRYLVRIEAFSGQGGPDYSYELKILPGVVPQDVPPAGEDWEERDFTRHLSANRLNELAARGARPQSEKPIETYRATAGAAGFKTPGTLEGVLARPGEAHRARFHVAGPQDLAIEVETPAAAPPVFNPIVRLLNPAGEEAATNVLAGRGGCDGALIKSIQPKTIVPLREAGDYTVEIRETTADLAGPEFRYRVQVRPQIPHIGRVKIDTDHLNIAGGEAKTVRVMFDREEDYQGAVAVAAESLPPGVQALAGADFEPDKDPPRFPGKRERYTPRTERSVVVFTASAGAPPMQQPQVARLVVRPVVDGKPGEIVATRRIPVMVISKP
jgi:hypothetical protein